MKITVLTKSMKDALARLKTIVGRKTTLPILGNILLEADGECLRLTGTDLDQQLTINLSADVKRPGRATLPCAALYATMARLNAGEMSLEIDGKNTATLRSGSHQARLLGLPAEEFPELIKAVGGSQILITGELLGEWLRRSLPFVGTDATRFILTGVHFTSRDGCLVIESTNGHAMVIISSELSSCLEGAILPSDAVRTLSDLAGESEVALNFTESLVEAHAGNWRFVSKQIEGTFPNTTHLIPAAKDRKRKIEADRAALIEALEFAAVFCSKEASAVRIESAPGRDILVIADNPQGEGVTEVQGSTDNSTHTLQANVNYLLEMLTCFGGERVKIQLVDERSPVLIEENGVLTIVMPMRLS